MRIPQNRPTIWIAISEAYLDTELKEVGYKRIADIFKESSLSIQELKQIDLYEVFPSLYKNILSVAGEWTGFEEKWLIEVCTENFKKKSSKPFQAKAKLLNLFCYKTRKNFWTKVESMMADKKNPSPK